MVGDYERVQLTFSKNDEFEKCLYSFLDDESKASGKSAYIKQMLYEKIKIKDSDLYEKMKALR